MVHHLIAAALLAAMTGLLTWWIGRARPARISAQGGAIAPERVSAALIVAFGLMLASAGLMGLLTGRWLLGGGVVLFGLGLAGFTAPSLTRLHMINWTATVVEGPSRTFGPTLGRERTTIAWADIATVGKTATGYWYIQSKDGRRIYWSWLYKGHVAFNTALQQHCPGMTERLA